LEGKSPRRNTRNLPAEHQQVDEPKFKSEEFPALQDISAQLKSYGIITVPTAVYEWGGYRYGNASDAIAAAKRSASK
jgi:hypothetical protein